MRMIRTCYHTSQDWCLVQILDKVFEVSVGPISSNWDRAIEVFYQLKGGQVDYGKGHSRKYNIIQKTTSKEYKQYKTWFDFVYNHSKNDYKTKVDFDEWADGVYDAYRIREKVGKTKLALLNFWYDALKNHDNDPEFWTDILYFGMKITTKGQFAPYSKIS